MKIRYFNTQQEMSDLARQDYSVLNIGNSWKGPGAYRIHEKYYDEFPSEWTISFEPVPIQVMIDDITKDINESLCRAEDLREYRKEIIAKIPS